jgi:hypothetical protein
MQRVLWRFNSIKRRETVTALTFRATYAYRLPMSTVAEIKAAIERLSPRERNELEALLWPDWDRDAGDTPPGIREKLAEADKSHFKPGDRSSIADGSI